MIIIIIIIIINFEDNGWLILYLAIRNMKLIQII
jgi:hypothetical protein